MEDQFNAELTEAVAARDAVSLAKELMLHIFSLEGDTSSVIKLICSSEEILSNMGSVIVMGVLLC